MLIYITIKDGIKFDVKFLKFDINIAVKFCIPVY
jgi:hypothetical protein